ncbi:hypothetical protein HFO56_39265 [Rhizobium laguerreae]|uniref:hypothetical protein n=1 Tax=Rhizobium laguerreae TaxID=1076926 RepID=UPI001C92578F|nr:hypothetical protein [Rhizobium laguerreae]MBY3158341.1 hypothetical protein [Rhizobium laguerreae]
MEFHYQLLVAELKQAVESGAVDVDDGRRGVVEAIKCSFEDGDYGGTLATAATWDQIVRRLDQIIGDWTAEAEHQRVPVTPSPRM